MQFLFHVMLESWHMLLDSAVYILFGLLAGGLLKVFLSPASVARHLGQGRFGPVFKAALFGIPLPLCSCGVLPAAASLKKQGANNGATTAFLISTPESGVDSISITYALLDPLMTVARPVAAFLSAVAAGLLENSLNPPAEQPRQADLQSCSAAGCCGGADDPARPTSLSFRTKLLQGARYAAFELWGDLAGWFFAGLLLGGVITVLLPESLISGYLGGGLGAMLIMLMMGIPIYICATASTPIAAALILKGVSPGAALVFLLVGPATNMATLTILTGLLGKRATLRYLATLSLVAVGCGLLLDQIYHLLHFQAQAVAGEAADLVPFALRLASVFLLLALSVPPLWRTLQRLRPSRSQNLDSQGCGCSGECSSQAPRRLG